MTGTDAFDALKAASAELKTLSQKVKTNRTKAHAIATVTVEWRELDREYDSLQKEWNEAYRLFAVACMDFQTTFGESIPNRF